MNPQGIANKPEQNLSIESGGTLTAVGWTSRHKIFSPPVEAELFFLTSLFIELIELIVSIRVGIPTEVNAL
jgi:hypothetical protein